MSDSPTCQNKVSPIVDEIHYPKTSAEYIPSLQVCDQLVTGWAGDAENWGSPRGASMQEQTLMSMKREGGRDHSFLYSSLRKDEWLWRDHSQI